jgi:hypothetical protein
VRGQWAAADAGSGSAARTYDRVKRLKIESMGKDRPLSPAAFIGGLIVTILGGVIVCMLVVVGRNESAPTTVTLAPISIKCPQAEVSRHLGPGKGLGLRLQEGCYYYFNVACDGCQAGEENNFVIFYAGGGINVTLPEGSVWQYSRVPNAGEVCSDTRDHWPTSLPSFLNVLYVQQLFPCS